MHMQYYAFIVGVNQDWPEQRCSHGDIGLARCLVGQHVQLPKEHLVEVYDERATRSNILHSLESLLDLRRRRNKTLSLRVDSPDTLLFYYGGHGKHREFCTGRHSVKNGEMHTEPWIKHSDIIDLLERKFKGGTVWCIIDCCHSGGFGQAVVQKYRCTNSLNVSYGCIMSVPPADEAGPEWTMTECFIRAFTGELSCSSKMNYLSTKNGKHPINNNISSHVNATKENIITQPTWEQVIEYLADEMARIKGDRLTTLFLGKGMDDRKLLNHPCTFRETTSDLSCSSIGISRDESWMEPFRRRCHAVNDGVVVKYVGSASSDRIKDNMNITIPVTRIGWFPGRIISINQPNQSSVNRESHDVDHITACIELYDAILQTRWTITLSLYTTSVPSGIGAILGGLPFGFGFNRQACATAITSLANHRAYYDTSYPSGMQVKALWKDGKFYNGSSLCFHDVNWEEVDVDSSIGPCVPIRWHDDHSVSFVPTVACIVKSTQPKSSREKISSSNSSDIESSPRDVMMTSLVREGKTLHGHVPMNCGSGVDDDSYSWEAYDAEDCEWSPVTLMNNVNVSDLPVQVLANHMCYRESGAFSVIYWESDSSLSVVPNTFLRQQVISDDDSDEDSCASEVETADIDDVTKYISDIACSSPLHLSSSIHGMLKVGSLAVVFFGLGVLVGFKSKR